VAAAWPGVGDGAELEAADGVASIDAVGTLAATLTVGLADEVVQADNRSAVANRAVAWFGGRLVGIRRKRTRNRPHGRVWPAHRVGCTGI